MKKSYALFAATVSLTVLAASYIHCTYADTRLDLKETISGLRSEIQTLKTEYYSTTAQIADLERKEMNTEHLRKKAEELRSRRDGLIELVQVHEKKEELLKIVIPEPVLPEPVPAPRTIIVPQEVNTGLVSFYLFDNLMNNKNNYVISTNIVNGYYSWDKTFLSKLEGSSHMLNINVEFPFNDIVDLEVSGQYQHLASSFGTYHFVNLNFDVNHSLSSTDLLTYNLGFNGAASKNQPFLGVMKGISYTKMNIRTYYLPFKVDMGAAADLGITFNNFNANLIWSAEAHGTLRGNFYFPSMPELWLIPAVDAVVGISGQKSFKRVEEAKEAFFVTPFVNVRLKLDIRYLDLIEGRVFVNSKFNLYSSSAGVGLSIRYAF